MTAQTATPTAAAAQDAVVRTYLICRSKDGGYKAVRARKVRNAVPMNWVLVEDFEGTWEQAQARVTALVAERAASIKRANEKIRAVISASTRRGKTFRVTEAELAEKGLAGVLKTRVNLTSAMEKYLAWQDAGRPAL